MKFSQILTTVRIYKCRIGNRQKQTGERLIADNDKKDGEIVAIKNMKNRDEKIIFYIILTKVRFRRI